ncbi:hypothetical protein ACVR1I_00530 [Streptococcus cameli]
MNDKAKSKYLIRTLELFLVLLLFRIIEYFVIKTDRSFLAENFIHKVIGIIILFLFLRKTNKSQFVEVKQLNTSNDITTYETVNQKRFTVFSLSKKAERRTHGRRKKRNKSTTT